MGKTEWLGPYVILDTPSPVTHTLNLLCKDRDKKTVHRNALKPFITTVNTPKCIIATGSDQEGVMPIHENSHQQPKRNPRPSYLTDIGHLDKQRRNRVQTILDNFQTSCMTGQAQMLTYHLCSLKTTEDYPISL